MDRLIKIIKEAIFSATKLSADVTLTQDFSHGDLTTSFVMKEVSALSKLYPEVKSDPRSLGEAVVSDLRKNIEILENFSEITVAGPGYVNFKIKDDSVIASILSIHKDVDRYGLTDSLSGMSYVVEFTDPNPFKEFHIGHMYSNIVGESISKLLESQGATVHRVCYQGDIGLHVAKSIWGIQPKLKEKNTSIEKLKSEPLDIRVSFLGEAYSLGANKYEEGGDIADEIKVINQKLYAKDIDIYPLYQLIRKWSLDYFDTIYARLGTEFERLYFESEVEEEGKRIVLKNIENGIFKKSEGAVVFPGEEYGLHTRVFLNALGLPTYEAKELALAPKKYDDFKYDKSVIITGNEINEYFKVLLKVLSLISPDLAKKTHHIGHGMVRLPEGKMSSRTGKVVRATDMMNKSRDAILVIAQKLDKNEADIVGLAAIKYALLKNGIGSDISFDFDRSVALSGSSGPYLLYTYSRIKSLLKKANYDGYLISDFSWANEEEKNLARFLCRLPEVLSMCTKSYSPSTLCTYLFDLAQMFNSYYDANQIIGSSEESSRLCLVSAVSQVLKNGLYRLGIQTVERM